MQQTVRLLDSLGERYGAEHTYYNLRTPAEAIKMLCINRPEFAQELVEAHNHGVYYRVMQFGSDMSYDDLRSPLGAKDLYITPIIGGSGGGSTSKILLGAALVSFAVLTAGAGAGFLGLGAGLTGAVSATTGSLVSGSFVLGAAASTAIGSIGTAMILGGVADLIAPQPQLPKLNRMSGRGETSSGSGPQNVTRAMGGTQSYAYSGAGANTVGIGATVPIAFGKVLVSSHLLSIQVTTGQDKSFGVLRNSIVEPSLEGVTVNGERMRNKFKAAGGLRSRLWSEEQLSKSGVNNSSNLSRVDQTAGTNNGILALRNSEGEKQTPSLTLLRNKHFKNTDKRKNYQIFLELDRALFDRVGGEGTTRVHGFVTYRITLTGRNVSGPDPVLANVTATVQGLFTKSQKFRWCHAIEYPKFRDDENDAEIETKIVVIDHDTHKRPSSETQMRIQVRYSGYNFFENDSQNKTQGLLE
jgi:predicted phage tail protein